MVIDCENFSIARKMEIYVKRMKSWKFIKNLKTFGLEEKEMINRFKNYDLQFSGEIENLNS
jgi:hypothetical protein